ncbi:methyl-accepting chemotaxis protein [Niallia sp. Krafla_26]|uniref:methyl-accepting chemotaxis protein n=1 Tax=Niallia sp. Krafla_26 TaxID=3064703 RepID=UPI003D173BCF
MKNARTTKEARKSGGFMTKSIQNQILIPFLILLMITGAVVATVSYTFSVKNTTQELTKNVESQMVSLNDTFDMFFSNTNNTLNRFISNELLTSYQPEKRQDLLNYFGETKETTPSIANIYTVLDGTGEVIIYPEVDLGDDFNAKEREWYQQAVKANGETVWTEPYVDESTGETVVTVAKAYFSGNNLTGVMAADVMVGTLIDMIESVKIGETGYGVIFDKKGKFIAHIDPTYIGRDESQQEYYQKIMSTGKQGIVDYQFEGRDKIMAFTTNSTTGWILGGTVYVEEFEKQAGTILIPIAITLAVVLLVAIAVSIVVTNRITKPIKQVMKRMQEIASGDLSQEPLQSKYQNEIGQLVMATNEMNHKMRDILKQINAVSETVSSHSEELTQSANEVSAGNEQVAMTMQELAVGSETQANSASDLSNAMAEFSAKVQESNEHGEQIQETSNNVLAMSDEGSHLMDGSTQQMTTIDGIVKESVRKVSDLNDQSKEISKLVTVIKEIADQTNLLALNAAIEAARAGEHGKGFSVVAEEVRKLAEQTANSVTEITGIVGNIQKGFGDVTESLQDGYKEVEKGTNQIKTTGKTFNDIRIAVKEMVHNINLITENFADISASSQEMNSSTQEIAATAEEGAAGVEQTAATVQQTNSSMEEVAASSSQLAKLAEELNGLVRQFKI